MKTIRTKGFILRPLTLFDVDPFFEANQDPETIKGFESVPTTIEEALEEIKEMLDKVKRRVSEIWVIEVNGEYAGNVTLEYQNWDPSSDEGRVHLLVHPKFRGKGLGTKALQTVIKYGFKKKYKKIYAQCKASNEGVIRINETIGFKRVKEFTNDKGIKKILWMLEKS